MANSVLPNFLVIGVEKGGTTWLHAQLKKHPDVFLPPTKEIHFFNKYNSNGIAHDYFQFGLDWYLEFFKEYNGQKAIGEVTPMYICDPEAPARIKATLPNVKLIAMLRNPVQRAYSHYWMAKQKSHTTLASFKEVIEQKEPRFIERGLYYKQLKTYYELFDPQQILILFSEEVFKNPEYWLAQVCRFLGVDDAYYQNDSSVQEKVFEASAYKSAALLNKQMYLVHKMRRSKALSSVLNWMKRKGFSDRIKKLNTVEKQYEKMPESDAVALQQYYCEDLEALSSLLNRALPFQSK
ncbi:sulfotransferase domain-containing protein [Ilyomonas limi]|uniref:Sulfotransferase domain-containing protein n=1 Tax=Ilyomonas limi TaxID=2575867 RepID=A0A4U3KZ89_9BACT|nr:sulfotransferase domain-containing protein [Ilyomonas limi]TKK67978.1 sulfotransferase domain-containing protein [Ilyomonas limi]